LGGVTSTPSVSDPDELIPIRLLRLPVAIWAQAQEHVDDLLREFTLIAQQLHERGDRQAVPVRLVTLVERLTEEYGGLNAEAEQALAAAAAAGENEVPEFTIQAPRRAAEPSRHLGAMLDEADEYCRGGTYLLTLATPSEARRFRAWYLNEVIRQLDGEQPVPWPDYQG
jgi:hypothetical protein